MMENILSRFPVIGQEIFKQVDNPNLTKCKEVCHSWGYFLNNETLVWLRMLQKYNKNHVEFQEDWKKVTTKVPCEILKRLAIATEQFYTFCSKRLQFQHSPMHIVSERGILSLCKFIADKNVIINPKRKDGFSAFHFAAQEGHLDVCQFFLSNINEKNPADDDGWTPLLTAGHSGHLETYKCIAENLEDKNPAVNDGWTPLDFAIKERKLEFVKYIIENVQDKSSVLTPIYQAALKGDFEIFKLFADNVEVRNLGIFDGHDFTCLDICKAIIGGAVYPNFQNSAENAKINPKMPIYQIYLSV